jgi:hypothetical protein
LWVIPEDVSEAGDRGSVGVYGCDVGRDLYNTRAGVLTGAVQGVGFQGDYSADLWDWMKEEAEGFGSVIESNWMKTWRQVCIIYLRMRREHRGR